jgi:hypothetical protein
LLLPVLQNHRALRSHDLELQSQGLPCDAVYAGYRVDRHDESFMIHDGVVWEVLDEPGVRKGQVTLFWPNAAPVGWLDL